MIESQFTHKSTDQHKYGLLEIPQWSFGIREDGMVKRSANPDVVTWSNDKFPPVIGTKVTINFNGLGSGIVVAYFFEHGYLGIEVKLDQQPDWHIKQNGKGKHALVFGAEIRERSYKFAIRSIERNLFFIAIHGFTPFYGEKEKAFIFDDSKQASDYALKELFTDAKAFEVVEL